MYRLVPRASKRVVEYATQSKVYCPSPYGRVSNLVTEVAVPVASNAA
jgi:hypothetical protein